MNAVVDKATMFRGDGKGTQSFDDVNFGRSTNANFSGDVLLASFPASPTSSNLISVEGTGRPTD